MSNDLNISGASDSVGATIRMAYMKRTMVIYGIEEQELDSIADTNYHHTLWWSIASVGVGVFLGCAWDMLNAPGKIANSSIGFAAFVVLATIGAWFVAQNYKRRGDSRLRRIKERSEQIASPPS